MAHQLIQHQEIGKEFSGVYYMERVYKKLTTTNKEYTDMMLRDKSGSRNVKFWGVVEVEQGDFVFVSARVEEYQGAPSIIAMNVDKEDEPDDLSNYIPVYEDLEQYSEDFDYYRAEIAAFCKELKDPTCELVVDEVFKNGAFFSKFVKCPGSVKSHYGKQGGLLANTVKMTKVASNIAKDYGLDETEKMILLTAGLIGRTGGVDCYQFEDCMPVETKRGVLVGLSALSVNRVWFAIQKTASAMKKDSQTLNQDIAVRILHACVSCTGYNVKPMTKEAMVLSSAGKANAEVVGAVDFIANDLNEGEEFTAYDPANGRRYFKG